MVRTDPLTEVLSNMKLSFGASPGPVVRPTGTKNDFLLSYKGVGIGDEVAVDKNPPSPPRSKKRQEPSWATPPRAWTTGE